MGAAVLIMCNKNDIEGALSAEQIANVFFVIKMCHLVSRIIWSCF